MAAPNPVTGGDAVLTSSIVSGGRNLRTCQVCRGRKIKCNRQQPCSNCARAGVACVYPLGRGRAPKRPRKATESYVADRLSRLEAIIRELDRQSHSKGPVTESKDLTKSETDSTASGLDQCQSDTDHPANERPSRLMVREQSSYYVNDNALWGNLADEVEELREMLLDPGSDDEGSNPPTLGGSGSTPSPSGMNAAIFGYRSLAHSLHSLHPSLAQAVALFRVFTDNVAPMVRIFHLPTLSRDYWDALASLDSISKDTEAVLFTVYYTAIISLTPQRCMDVLNMPREQALAQFRFAVEQSLARANFLNTQSITLLQAATCFVLASRNEDDSRTPWSLASLIYHTAHTMGLHRDGTRFGLKPFETEMRRRLWWHICVLDNRSAEYHGFEPFVNDLTFDTKPPLNINDSDIDPNMPEFPPERSGFTEMTFTLIRVESMGAAWKLFRKSGSEYVLSFEQQDTLFKEYQERVENKYLRHCDPSIPSQLIVLLPQQLIFKRLWLLVHSPRGTNVKIDGPQTHGANVRDQLFRTSIEILELSSRMLLDQALSPWHWQSHTYIQWSAVAFVLSELCARPRSAECDRGWKYVQEVYDAWKLNERAQKSTIWRPLRRMMAKARYVREMQQTEPKRRGQGSPTYLHTSSADPAVLPAAGGSDSTTTSAYTAGVDLQLETLRYPADFGLFGGMFGDSFSMDFTEDIFNYQG